MIRFTHLQLKDISKSDAVTVVALRNNILITENDVKGDYPNNSIVAAKLRTANLTAISIMANIFY